MTTALVGSAKITIEGDLSAFATSAESQIREVMGGVASVIDNNTESVAQKFGQVGASGGEAFVNSVNSAVGQASTAMADSASMGSSAAVDGYGTVGAEAGAAFTDATGSAITDGAGATASAAADSGQAVGEAVGTAYTEGATSSIDAGAGAVADALGATADDADVSDVFGSAGSDAGGAFSDGVNQGVVPSISAMPDAINTGKPLVVAAAQDAGLEAGKKSGGKFGEAFHDSTKAIMTTLFAGGGLFAGAELLKGSLEAASAGQQAAVKTKNVFGEAGESVIKFAEDSVSKLRETSDEIQAQVSAFGQYFHALGVSQEDAAKMSESLTTVTDNVAAFNGVSQDAVQGAFDAAIKGRSSSLKQYGISIDAATLAHEALSHGLVDSNTKMKDGVPILSAQQKGLATYYAILDQTKNQQNGLAASAGTAAGRQAEFRAQLGQFEEKLGKGLLPILAAFTNFMTTQLFPALGALSRFWGENEAWLKPLLLTLAEGVLIYKGLKLASEGWTAVTKIAKEVQVGYNAVVALFAGEAALATAANEAYNAALAAGATEAEAAAAAQAELDAAMDANPIFLIVAALALLAAGFYYAYTHSKTFRDFINGIGRDLKAVYTTVLQPVVNFFEHNWKTALMIAGAVLLPFIALPIIIYKNWGAITHWFSNLWGDVEDIFNTAKDATIGFIKEWYPEILGVLTLGLLLMPALIYQHWQQIVTYVRRVWDDAVGIVKAVPGRILSTASNMFSSVLTGASKIVGWVKTPLDSVVKFFEGFPSRIAHTALHMFDGVAGGFKAAINWIIDAWNNFHISLPSISLGPLGSIGGQTINFPDIPNIASGADILARAGGTLTRLGEGGQDETVVNRGVANKLMTDLDEQLHRRPLTSMENRPAEKATGGDTAEMLKQLNTLTAAVMRLANRPIVLKTDNRTIAKSANDGNNVLARVS